MVKILRTVTVVSAVMGICAAAWADDGVMESVGGAVKPLHGAVSVRMVEEEVHIADLPHGRVTAHFVFHNEGAAMDILMGFPGYSMKSGAPNLENFASTVDGKRVETHRVLVKTPIKELPTDEKGHPVDDEDRETVWYTKRVHFYAGQTHIVTDTYDGGYSWNTSGQISYSYVMQTGAGWKGTIGHAVITCDINGLSTYSLPKIEPAGYHRTGSMITWDWRNIEPTDKNDIGITYSQSFDSVVVDGKPIYAMDPYADGPPTRYLAHKYEGPAADEPPIRRGNDVWLPTETAADWLGAKREVVSPGKIERLSIGSRWVQITLGSPILLTASGHTTMRHPAIRDQKEETKYGGKLHTVIALSPLVRALGGKTWFARERQILFVTLP